MTNEFNPDWMCVCGDLTILGIVHRKEGPCYIPDKREWVGLTLEDKQEYVAQDFGGSRLDAMDWAEKRLKEKNT